MPADFKTALHRKLEHIEDQTGLSEDKAFLIWFLTSKQVPEQFVGFTPHLVTVLVLALASQRLRPPAADGLPYRKGQVQ